MAEINELPLPPPRQCKACLPTLQAKINMSLEVAEGIYFICGSVSSIGNWCIFDGNVLFDYTIEDHKSRSSGASPFYSSLTVL